MDWSLEGYMYSRCSTVNTKLESGSGSDHSCPLSIHPTSFFCLSQPEPLLGSPCLELRRNPQDSWPVTRNLREKGVRISLFGWEKQQKRGWPTLLLHQPNFWGNRSENLLVPWLWTVWAWKVIADHKWLKLDYAISGTGKENEPWKKPDMSTIIIY